MHPMGELDREGLPRAIPAQELQKMLGNSEAFCSWDACHLRVSELMARWPFLPSHLLTAPKKKPTR